MAESAASGHQKRQKKPKKYYNKKKMKCEDKMCVGMRGVLVFGVDRESAARREAYNLLNEYADHLFGTEFLENVLNHDGPNKLIIEYQHGTDEAIIVEHEQERKSEEESEEEDIEKTIAKEINLIKNVKQSRRFQCVTTGVHAIIFIKSTLSNENLNELVHFILSDLAKTKEKKARNFSRLVPATHICHANTEAIRKTVTEEFLPVLDGEEDDNVPKRFCVNYKARFNNTVTRNQVVNEIASALISSGHIVDLKTPDKVIIVEVMKGLCCMSMVEDFFKFRKYNIHEITNASSASESAGAENPSSTAMLENEEK